ncbi:transcriptional regulator [Pyrococcus furiosus DSM 3638]|uniref:Putative HTH-type transcriptional regulatory protein PF1851 n=4 Tax=Thermococcaceae TaxID=2259 RepID=Y1851_PYRFU|nr:transcriptional regulator [Pyrococcus furiosus]Q8TZX4.2 RecName: Full=Putative HTH-type transcriptional regulatory protein PF1851 [Pyrococcus furiosus DSM 3638]QEK79726.1 transcriptional regulator [Pyrococcus furiosus DSM 3638]
MDKEQLTTVVEKMLNSIGFKTARVSFRGGCFDLVATRQILLLFIKTLVNIDKFTEEQAEDLKRLAKLFRASALLVGLRTKNIELEDGVVYERFGIYAVNPETLFSILAGTEYPLVMAERGGFFVRIDGERLRELREKYGYSTTELAEMLGVSRKSVQRYEKGEGMVSIDVAIRLEEIFDEPLVKPIDIFKAKIEKVTLSSPPENELEKEVFDRLERLGMSVVKIKRAPFNAVTKEEDEEVNLLTGIDEKKTPSTIRRVRLVNQIAEFVESEGVFVLNEKKTEVVGKVPIIPKDILNKVRDVDELMEIIKELRSST